LRPTTEALLLGLTLALAFSLPFEPIHPQFTLGWRDINHLKLLLLTTLLVWAARPSAWSAALIGASHALLLLGIAGSLTRHRQPWRRTIDAFKETTRLDPKLELELAQRVVAC
jgi:hypothetical protein